MKNIKLFAITLVVIFAATGCGNDSNIATDNSNSRAPAPSFLAGKSYRMTISTGLGLYATSGTSTVVFSNTADTYKVLGDGVNSFNSSGSYTYTASGSEGNAAMKDSYISNGNFILTFTSATTGTYQATAQADPNSYQSGSFVEL